MRNFYFHDQQLRSNPPASEKDNASAPAVNPYGWQDHLFDKNQPEVIPFLERLRALFDRYEGSVGLGEIGESPARSISLLAEYTKPGRLHLCYSFDLLSAERSVAHFERVIRRFEELAGESWPCWAFSNHDVTRVATRLCPPGGELSATGTQLCALLLTLRGTPCLYQGDELALPEAEVPFEALVDPYGVEFGRSSRGVTDAEPHTHGRVSPSRASASTARGSRSLTRIARGLTKRKRQTRSAHSR